MPAARGTRDHAAVRAGTGPPLLPARSWGHGSVVSAVGWTAGCPLQPLRVTVIDLSRRPIWGSTVLELGMLDLEEIATALQDQDGWDHCWLIDPRSGQIGFWTEDGGIDGRTPVDLEDLDLIPIEPLPSWVWYRDMADFAEGISNERAGRSLARAIEGKGAFRRFKDRLHQNYPDLLPVWHAFQSIRAKRRAVQWLVDNSLVDQQAAEAVLASCADPDLS